MSSIVHKYISSGIGQIPINDNHVLFILFMVLPVGTEENHENLKVICLWAEI
jgi:hypothetical protein